MYNQGMYNQGAFYSEEQRQEIEEVREGNDYFFIINLRF